MAQDRLGRVDEPGAGGDRPLREVEIAVLGDRVVEAVDAVVDLAAHEEVRGLRIGDPHLPLVAASSARSPASSQPGSGRQSESQNARAGAEPAAATARLRAAYELLRGPRTTFTQPSPVASPSAVPSVDPSSPSTISNRSRGSVWRDSASISAVSSERRPFETGTITLTARGWSGAIAPHGRSKAALRPSPKRQNGLPEGLGRSGKNRPTGA